MEFGFGILPMFERLASDVWESPLRLTVLVMGWVEGGGEGGGGVEDARKPK